MSHQNESAPGGEPGGAETLLSATTTTNVANGTYAVTPSGCKAPAGLRPLAENYDADDVKRTADLPAMLTRISGEPRSKHWRCPVPAHEDVHPSCSTFEGDSCPLWKCHGCGAAGSAIELAAFIWPSADPCELINNVGHHYSTSTPSSHAPRRATRTPSRKQLSRPANRSEEYEQARRPDNAEELLALACGHRGWSVNTAHAWCLEVVCGMRGVPALRMPYTRSGEVLYWKDRHLTADGRPLTRAEAREQRVPTHCNPSGQIPAPFGLDRLNRKRFGASSLFVVEGEPDAITITEALEITTPVIALPGASNVQDRWLDAIVTWHGLSEERRVFVVTDNDEAGERLRERLSGALSESEHLHVPSAYNDITAWLGATSAATVATGLRAQTRSCEVAA